MLEMTIYQNEQFGQLRTTTKDGEPWFVAVDVCRALDIKNPTQALSRLDDDEKATVQMNEKGMNVPLISNEGNACSLNSMKGGEKGTVVPVLEEPGQPGKKDYHIVCAASNNRLDDDEKETTITSSNTSASGVRMFRIVSEPGFYALVLGSRKPEAKAFKRWVTHDVLPAIRQTGGYGAMEARPQLPEELRPNLLAIAGIREHQFRKIVFEEILPTLQKALVEGRAYLAPKGSTVYTTTDAVCIGWYAQGFPTKMRLDESKILAFVDPVVRLPDGDSSFSTKSIIQMLRANGLNI